MPALPLSNESDPAARRPVRFTIRTLLVATLVVATLVQTGRLVLANHRIYSAWVKFGGGKIETDTKFWGVTAEIEHADDPQLNDESLEHLRGLRGIVRLTIHHTGISDRAIPTLASLNRLLYLDIRATKMTTAGIDRLRNLLPECEIVSSPTTP